MAAASAPPWAVTVALASGRAVQLQLHEDERGTSAVRTLASRAFGFRVTALATQDGRRLPEGAALPDLGLEDGARLTAVVEPVIVHGSLHSRVFLAVVGDRFLAIWGSADAGGDISAVKAELEGAVIEKVCMTEGAVAVLTSNGRVITWGSETEGADTRKVCAELREGVREICAASRAFAAVKEDGRVVAWGEPGGGGSTELVQERLSQGVRCLSATDSAFAALRLDGTVVTWGDTDFGADSTGAEPHLRDVRQLVSGSGAFAALTGSGGMVAWVAGVRTPWREEEVQQVCLTEVAVAVLKADGAVKAWGFDGDQEAWAPPAEARSGVRRIYSVSSGAFAALTSAGRVVAWARPPDDDEEEPQWDEGAQFSWGGVRVESAVEDVFSTTAAFAALLSGGKVVAWGSPDGGGDCSEVQTELEGGVVHVASAAYAFAAVKAAGEVVTWGNASFGGDSSAVAALLRPLQA